MVLGGNPYSSTSLVIFFSFFQKLGNFANPEVNPEKWRITKNQPTERWTHGVRAVWCGGGGQCSRCLSVSRLPLLPQQHHVVVVVVVPSPLPLRHSDRQLSHSEVNWLMYPCCWSPGMKWIWIVWLLTSINNNTDLYRATGCVVKNNNSISFSNISTYDSIISYCNLILIENKLSLI